MRVLITSYKSFFDFVVTRGPAIIRLLPPMERKEQIARLRQVVAAERKHPNNLLYLFLSIRKESGYGCAKRMIKEIEVGGEFATLMARTATALHRKAGKSHVISIQNMVDACPRMTTALNRITYGRIWKLSGTGQRKFGFVA